MRKGIGKVVIVFSLYLASLLAPPVATAVEKVAENKSNSAPVAPLSTGYEAAIAAHTNKPIFRPTGTAPAVWGPGDMYSLLLTGKESSNALFQFEAIVPEGGGPPPMCIAERMKPFTSCAAVWKFLSETQRTTLKQGISFTSPEAQFTGSRMLGAAQLSS